jgi:hypothetical protein
MLSYTSSIICKHLNELDTKVKELCSDICTCSAGNRSNGQVFCYHTYSIPSKDKDQNGEGIVVGVLVKNGNVISADICTELGGNILFGLPEETVANEEELLAAIERMMPILVSQAENVVQWVTDLYI